MLFEEQKIVIIFLFNHIIDVVIRKLFGGEGQDLCWKNDKQLDEGDGDVMNWDHVNFDAWFAERIYFHQRYEESAKTNAQKYWIEYYL
jgi:hypothetical protein